MSPSDERALRWWEAWERRRQRCLRQDEVGDQRSSLAPEALAILEEARALAAVADPLVHAAAPVDLLIERVNDLPHVAAVLLHGPVCNGLSMLRLSAQELLAAGAAPPRAATAARPRRAGADGRAGSRGRRGRFDWFLVVGDGAEMVELAEECSAALTGSPAVRAAGTVEAALEALRREGGGIVLTSLILPSDEAGPGPHGLRVAREARRRRHAVLLLTAASDYLDYWPRLAGAGLTGHDVVVKTRADFATQLVRRVWEIVEPEPLRITFDQDTGHVVHIGDVEVSHLEAQEALVLRFLDATWQTPEVVADACAQETDLAPTPGGVPPLISTLRHKLAAALVDAESPCAQREVIESRRREGLPTQYRLAPWLRRDDPPEPAGAAPELPPVLVVEDDPDWAQWVIGWLEELRWPASVAATVEDARRALSGTELPVVVADLGLRRAADEVPDPEAGLTLIEEVSARRHGMRVVVLSAFGGRDTLRARLFEAGVRTVDVIDKAAGRDECRAVLLTSLQRAADEVWRGVRRGGERSPVHRVVRLERAEIEVDGVGIMKLSPREAQVLDMLFAHANQPVKAELLELCFPTGPRSGHNPPLNKVQLTVSRLRSKIDRSVGRPGTGESVIRTRHRGAMSTYELYGVVTDPLR